jgi:hypothetical protein
MVGEHHRQNLDTIKKAMDNGDLGLIECTRKDNGETVVLIAARYTDDDKMTVMVPLAVMFDEDPYQLFTPPGHEECELCGTNKSESFPSKTASVMCELCGSPIDENEEFCMNSRCPNNPLGPPARNEP